MLYLLHGADELTRSEELTKLKAKLGDPTTISLNTTVLDARKGFSLPALIQACDALPFMAKRRLVIVEEFWSRFEAREGGRGKDRQIRLSSADENTIKELQDYLPRLPETTGLVFVESRSLQSSNPVFRLVRQQEKKAYVKEFSPPKEWELGAWVVKRMKAKGGSITAQAAEELARFIGNDLRQLDKELEKLWAYVNFQGTIRPSDVRNLVSATHTDSVFALVDAIGLRQREKAMRTLHELLAGGAAPPYLLNMIERQFRVLLQLKELQLRNATQAEMQSALGIGHSFIVEKGLRQAANFTVQALESIYQRLVEVEQQIKTGEIEDLLALDLLVVELCI